MIGVVAEQDALTCQFLEFVAEPLLQSALPSEVSYWNFAAILVIHSPH